MGKKEVVVFSMGVTADAAKESMDTADRFIPNVIQRFDNIEETSAKK